LWAKKNYCLELRIWGARDRDAQPNYADRLVMPCSATKLTNADIKLTLCNITTNFLS
jgi:hypothetical protein